jgi:hypothetical protein
MLQAEVSSVPMELIGRAAIARARDKSNASSRSG